MIAYYKLEGHTPVKVARDDWVGGRTGTWDRIAEDVVNGYRVSTVFLGIDHNLSADGPPILFETMAFKEGSWNDIACERYSTWDAAEIGHALMVDRAKAGLFEDGNTD